MSNSKKVKLPPIGLRIIKSAVAVLLCFMVDWSRGGAGIVFYSQLSALWCMQDYVSETKKKARQRIAGTVIGAVYGLISLVIASNFMLEGFSKRAISDLMISCFIVIIIYTTVVLKKKDSSYFSCVVFLSIVVNHANDINPYIFVLNRVLDTLIGIVIGVGVNLFEWPKKKCKDILFVSGLDDTILNKNNNMSPYSKVELNRMIEDGLKFTISTIRTPASLIEPLKDINLNLPVIVMDGAALYNIREKQFEKVYVIPKDDAGIIKGKFEALNMSYFTNIIIEDSVLIYYGDSENEAYNDIVSRLRKSPYRNYIKRPAPADEDIVYFMSIDKTDRIMNLYYELQKLDANYLFKIVVSPAKEYEGYSYIKIYNHNATKRNMLEYLTAEMNLKKVVTFGTIKDSYTYLIDPGDTNRVVKLIKKDFEK